MIATAAERPAARTLAAMPLLNKTLVPFVAAALAAASARTALVFQSQVDDHATIPGHGAEKRHGSAATEMEKPGERCIMQFKSEEQIADAPSSNKTV